MISKAARVLMLGLATCALTFLQANATAATDLAGARLEQSSLPARGKNQTLLTVDAFGRYAVTVSSAQGVGLQALDRMAGAGPVFGEAGKRDGRLDLFLDRGETRIITHGAAQASGEAKLTAHAFQELNARPPLLVEQRWEQASLGDFQQRSYWLDIKEERTVALEAAGRHLADLRLWRDGIWLVDSAPEIERNDARPDRPLTVARLTARLAPGLYLLTAYGGPGQPWTETSTDKPFHLRWGLPSLPPALRQRFVMNELGVERFRVPVVSTTGGPTYFRLELPAARDASLQVGRYAPEAPLQNDGPSATISKKSAPPVAELTWDGNGDRLITVRTAPGQPYVLQHFEARQEFRFSQAGAFWLSTLQAGHAEDAAGAGAVLTRIPERGRETYVADRVIEFGPKSTWHRRFNLLDELTLFVKLPANGKIGVIGQGVKARYRFEPFLTSRPANYQPPPWRDSGYAFELDAGLYVLTVQPVNKGILDLQLQALDATEKESGWLEAAKNLLGLEETKPSVPAASAAITPVTASLRFTDLVLEPRSTYRLYMNKQPGVATGIVLRPLPVDLGQSLPVSQRPGERLTIPVSVPEAGTLRALSEEGQALEIGLADGRKGSALAVAAGRHQVSVQAGSSALNYVLAFEPTRLASSTPLPPLPDTRLAELPKFPVISPDAPQFLTLGRQSGATFNVHVDRPGLYRIESGGLLQTAGKVRTRINPGLFEASSNGVGRNFLIQRYLREGEYQLGVNTEGETRGDLELRLARTDLNDGGELRPGETARALLQTGQALAYRLRVGKRANYRLQAMGLGRNFAMRLEDEAGWPLDLSQAAYSAASEGETGDGTEADQAPEIGPSPAEATDVEPTESSESAEPSESTEPAAAPRVEPLQTGAGVVESGDVTLELKPGVYRVLVLPQSVDARVLTRFEQVPEARRFEGHGPHRLVLGTPVQHTWQEPEKGKLRISDHWRFTLPAAAEVSISLDAGMEANLLDDADRSRRLAHIPAGRAWKGILPAGGYLLRVRHSRGDNLVDYRLTVASKELLAGQTRDLTAPASVPLSVGKNGLVVLQSFGNTDVRARLLDAEGRVIAQNDDQSDEWNFQIAQRLTPGNYTLVLEPAGAQSEASKARRRANQAKVATTVGMRMPREILEPALAPGSDIDIKDAHVHVYPIAMPAAANLLLASARARIAAGLALEGEGERGWVNLGSALGRTPYLLLPLAAERFKSYRLRAWATEPRGLPLRLRVAAADLPPTDEERWLRGDAPTATVDQGRPDLRVAAVKLAQPGSFRIWSDTGAWQWTDSAARAAESGGSGAIAVSGALLWLLSETGTTAPAGERLRLSVSKSDPLHLLLADSQTGQVDLPPAGPAPKLVLADTRGGQPGVAFGSDREVAGMGLVPGQAVAVALPGATAPVTVWNAGGTAPIEVDLRLASLQPSPAQALAPGVSDASLKAGEALPLGLPPGAKRVGLSLAAKTAAVLVRADRILATHWSGGEDLRESIETDADRLWLLNAGDEEVRYNIEVAPAESAPPPLRPGGLVEHNLAAAGRLRLPVELPAGGAEGLRLHVRGDVQALWQEAGGRILAGNAFSPRAGGALWLWHKPGPLVAWLDGPAGAVPPDAGLAPTWVTPPQSILLKGGAQLLAFHSEQPAMLHLRSETPMVSQFLLPGQAPRTEAHLHGASLNLAAPAGEAKLLLRALGAAGLTGSATLLATPATPIAEGMGPEALLPPGGARLYSFELQQAATIGIGVRASSDVARCILYDPQGAPLGEGVVQMPELKPGRYLLAVEIPADSPPVRVRPVLLGTQAPDTRPPYDILRRYVEAGEEVAGLIYVPPAAAPEPAQAAAETDEPAPTGDAGAPPAEE